MGPKKVTLSWEGHHRTMLSVFEKLLESSSLVDCTIVAEGRQRKAHKEVLLAFSPFFQILMEEESEKNPTIILSGFTFQELSALIDYMYYGNVVVSEDKVENLIDAAQSLQIRGLGGDQDVNSESKIDHLDVLSRPVKSSRAAHKHRKINDIVELSVELPADPLSLFVTPLGSGNIPALSSNERGRSMNISSSGDISAPTATTDVLSSELTLKVEPADADFSEEMMEEAIGTETFGGEMESDEQEQFHGAEFAATGEQWNINKQLERGYQKTSVRGDANSSRKKAAVASAKNSHQHPRYSRDTTARSSVGNSRAKCYDCSVCEKVFLKPSRLESHMRSHTGEKPFKCSECELSFANSSYLKVHRRRHSGERPFKCFYCEYASTTSCDLAVHCRRHTGEKPFKCCDCEYECTTSSNLAVHRRRRHKGK